MSTEVGRAMDMSMSTMGRNLRQSLDPSSLPAAGKPSRGDSILDMRRAGPKPPPLSIDNGHVGQLPTSRDVPSFPRLRHPEFMLNTSDIEGATPKPAPGEILGPRVLPSGDASLKKNSRNLNPNVPVYTWNSDSSINPEHLITPPSDMVKGVPPIGGRHELDTCDRFPQTRLLMRPGSKAEEQDRMGCADIEGASPASAMGIKPRKTPHASVDYGDVFHSSPHAWRRDAGHYTAFSGQLGQMIMVPGPEGKRDSRPAVDGAKFPPSHWRTVPTHPLDPQYTYDPVGQLCRYKTALDVQEAKSPAAIAARKQANGDGPQGELMGRMDDLRHKGPFERASVRKYATKTGFSRIHVNRPFPVVTGYMMTL